MGSLSEFGWPEFLTWLASRNQKGGCKVSSFKPKSKSSEDPKPLENDQTSGKESSGTPRLTVNQQVKAGISALRDFLAGRSGEAKAADSSDKETREVLATELLSVMAGSETGSDSTQPANANDAEPISDERERARQVFVDHGYFDEAVETLRTASSPDERTTAARALGLVGKSTSYGPSYRRDV